MANSPIVKIRIESPFDVLGGKVYINDVELPNDAIKYLEYVRVAGKVPQVTIGLIGEVEIDGKAIIHLQRDMSQESMEGA